MALWDAWETMYPLLSVIVLILDIAAIVDILQHEEDQSAGWKLLWILIVLALPLLGMILYFLLGRRTSTA